jgi:hypothetical protein
MTIPFVNDRDVELQTAPSRFESESTQILLLGCSANVVKVSSGGTPTPASVSFSATLIGITGTVAYSTSPATALTVAGNNATLALADMTAPAVTVTVTLTYDGSTYTAHETVVKVTDGASGSRGAGHYYASGSAWSNALADSVTPGAGSMVNDVVTISDGTTFTLTKVWDGSAWVPLGAVFDGSLFVTGSIQSSAIDTRGMVVRATDGTPIVGVGFALNAAYAAPGTQNSGITIGSNGVLSGAGGGQVTLPGMGHNTYRVVARGNSAVGVPAADGFYVNGARIYSGNRSYTVVILNRSTGNVYDFNFFDVYDNGALSSGRDAGTMAGMLNAYGSDKIAVVFSADEPMVHRFDGNLAAAMYRCGASRAVFGSQNFKSRSAYILVGICGCGEGNGAEAYQGEVNDDPNSWCDIGFSIVNGQLTGVSNSFTPKTLTDYGYNGSMVATSDLTLIGRNCNVVGNTFTKTTASGAWDSDCYSRESFTGGCYVTATVTDTSMSTMIGLNDDPWNGTHWDTINYAFYHEGPNIYVFGGGTQITPSPIGTCAPGDTITVAYNGVAVRYILNGVVLYTQSAPAGLKLYMDSSMYHLGSGWANVRFGPLSSNVWADQGGAGKPEDNANFIPPSRGNVINIDPALEKPSAWIIESGIVLQSTTTAANAVGSNNFNAPPGAPQNIIARTSDLHVIDPNQTYSLTANLYAAAGNTRNMYVFVNFFDQGGTWLAAGWGGTMSGYTFGGLPTTGAWYRQGGQFGAGVSGRAIPANARKCNIGVWFRYDNGSSEVEQGAQDIRLERVINSALLTPSLSAAIDDRISKSVASILGAPVTISTSGAIQVGNASWTGSAPSGTGVVMSPKGIAGVTGGVPQFTIDENGNATFKGNIAGATGTFAGNVATGTGTGFRVEMGPDDPIYAMWAGSGTKTDGNALFYLKRSGAAYFGGALSSGTLKTSVSNPSIAADAEIIDGPFGSIGHPITVNVGYDFTMQASSSRHTYSMGSTPAPQATVQLWNGSTLVQTVTINGTNSVMNDSEPGVNSFAQVNISGGFTYTDTSGSTANRTFRAIITNRQYPSASYFTDKGSGVDNATSFTQRLSITTTEQ